MELKEGGEYSLHQRFFFARMNKHDKVTLTLKEADNTLAEMRHMSEKLAACMECLTPEEMTRIFPPDPDDDLSDRD